MKEFGTFDAKNHFSALLELVAQGEDILITRHGRPVARLVPPEGAHRKPDAAAAAQRLRTRAKVGKFNWSEWQIYRDDGRRG